MALQVKCPHCRATIRGVDEHLAPGGDNRIECPECGRPFRLVRKPAAKPPATRAMRPAESEATDPHLDGDDEEPLTLERYDAPPRKPLGSAGRPRAMVRPRDDDDEPEERDNPNGVYLLIGLAGLTLLCIAGGIILLTQAGSKDPVPAVAENKNAFVPPNPAVPPPQPPVAADLQRDEVAPEGVGPNAPAPQGRPPLAGRDEQPLFRNATPFLRPPPRDRPPALDPEERRPFGAPATAAPNAPAGNRPEPDGKWDIGLPTREDEPKKK